MRRSSLPYPWAEGPSRARPQTGAPLVAGEPAAWRQVATAQLRAKTSAATRLVKPAAALTLAFMLGACSLNSGVSSLESEPELITSSVTKPVKAEGIDSTDAELIKNVVAEADTKASSDNALAWSNPDTGNRGTIMAIDRFIGSHGQKCKKFQTTVDSFMGISLYNGETCELRKGFWVLSWFLRKDE